MSLTGGDLGEEGIGELQDDVDSGSGFFNDNSRRAALAAALPLVATYFVRGQNIASAPASVVASRSSARPGRRRASGSDPVIAALRLRVALVAAAELSGILRAVAKTANFRYDLVHEEHLGHPHGRLDVPRYLRQRARRDVPRRYPVVNLHRTSSTPENVLAAVTATWAAAELDSCLTELRLLPQVLERNRADQLRSELARLALQPVLRDAAESAALVTRRETVAELLERVESRIRAGHVARPQAYERLTTWTRRTIGTEPTAAAGSLAAEFYDASFDDKLFELWCLHQLVVALTMLLGPARQHRIEMLGRDTTTPVATWDVGADTIEVYFQPTLERLLGGPNRWRYVQTGRRLQGYPDLGLRCRHLDGTTESVLVDAKLRRRQAAFGQEIYKLLGYTANAERPVRFGALVFHAPEGYHGPSGERRSTLENSGGGRIELVRVDPADPDGAHDAFAHLARLALTAAGISSADLEEADRVADADPEASTSERTASRAQVLAVAQLEAMARRMPENAFAETTANLSTMLGPTWDAIGDDARRMVATAVYFGLQAPTGADLAGPVLGLCAALERLLRVRFAVPALHNIRNRPGCNPNRWTLGTLIMRIREGIRGETGRTAREFDRALSASDLDRHDLDALLEELDQLRGRHRNQAAHQGLIEQTQWREVYRTVVYADRALLPRLSAALDAL